MTAFWRRVRAQIDWDRQDAWASALALAALGLLGLLAGITSLMEGR